MPRTRKPQSGVARPAGRVASTTTGATKNVPSPVVYRIPTGRQNPNCATPSVTIYGTKPIHVKEHNPGEYEVYLNEAEFKALIEGYEELDLSKVEVTFDTVKGPVTVEGNLNVENGILTAKDANIEELSNKHLTSNSIEADALEAKEGAINELEIEEAYITDATINTENVDKSIINEAEISSATIEIEEVAKSKIEEAEIEKEVVEESEIKKATIAEENVEKSVIVNLGAGQAHVTSFDATQATVSREFNSNGTANFNGENVFNSDITANENVNVAGTTTTKKLNVAETTTLDGQLNANANANFSKNVNVEGNTTLNTQVVNGYATFNDRTTFNEDTSFNDTLTANSNVTLNGHTDASTITAKGEATFRDAVQIDKNLNVDGNAVVEGNQRIDGSLSVGKESEFKSHLTVGGKLNATNAEVAGTTTTTALEVTTRANIEKEEVAESKIKKLTVTDELIIPDEALAPFQARSEKDKANGYAGLDENGKIAIEELPDSVTTGMHYSGAWEPSSDYPANPKLGDTYKVSANGEKSGVVFSAGDVIIYNGSSWDLIPSADDVVSVNGKRGVVTGIEETENKVSVLDKTNPSETKYTSEYAVVNALSAVEGRVNTNAEDIANLESALNDKANKSDVYTKIEVDQLVDGAVENSSAFNDLKDVVNTKASKDYVDGMLEGKADKDNVYNIAVMDQLLADKAHINHTHTISEVDGLSDRLATIESKVNEIDNIKEDIVEIKTDISVIERTLERKADLDSNGKLLASQLPDNVVTEERLQQILDQLLTKSYLEEKLGIGTKTFEIPITGQLAVLHDVWITDKTQVIWTLTDEAEGYIEWNVSNGAVSVSSTADENGTFYVTLFKVA